MAKSEAASSTATAPSNPNDFDLIVIGAGPGGYTAAIRAAQLGMRVACIEKETTLGGTCLNVGCIPSKALLDSSERYHTLQGGLAAHGIKVGQVELDLAAMLARKDKVVKLGTVGLNGLFKKNKIERVAGTARLLASNAVEVTNGEGAKVLRTKRILIATGSAPIALPNLPFDGKHIISSTEALTLKEVPKRLLVVGGGAIGLEMGSVWSRLGSKVLVVEFLDRIVPGMDRKMGELLRKSLEKQGFRFQLSTTAKSVAIQKGMAKVTLESAGTTSTEDCDVVLVAVGRRPFSEGLGAKEIGVAMDERGRVKVDAHYATNIEGIYAIGDVTAGPMLAHKAEEEGVAAVERMAGIAGHVNYDAIPNVVYTSPELASVGISEEQAQEQGLEIRIGTFPFMANARARCMGETEGMVKILADAKTDRVLGVHILGVHASDIIAEAAVAIEFHSSAEDLARSSHAHPTLPEAIKEAALAVSQRSINI